MIYNQSTVIFDQNVYIYLKVDTLVLKNNLNIYTIVINLCVWDYLIWKIVVKVA